MRLEIDQPTPARWDSQQHCWVLTRYADVRRAFQQPEIFASDDREHWEALAQSYPEEHRRQVSQVLPLITDIPVRQDGAAHTQQHALFSKVFTPRLVAQLRPKLERQATTLLEALGRDTFDIVKDFADPFCLRALTGLLGLPDEAGSSIKLWSAAHRLLVQALLSGAPTVAAEAAGILAGEYETLRDWVADGRLRSLDEQPRTDLISALAGTEHASYRLSDHEIAIFLHFLLLVAGHETTTHLISLSVWELLRYRHNWDYLGAHPESIPAVIPELARFTSPVRALPRFLRQDVTIDGQYMKRGETVLLGVASANRDPDWFCDPEILNIRPDMRGERSPAAASLAFGFGAHYCLGMSLARLEAEIAIGALIARFPDLEMSEQTPDLEPSAILRLLRRLRVRPHCAAEVSS